MKRRKRDKLAEDVLEAQKQGYGCHYGNYIADRQAGKALPPEIEEIEEPEVVRARCVVCGEPLTGNKMKYCGQARCEAGRKRAESEQPEKLWKFADRPDGKKCEICGGPLKRNQEKFCGKACQQVGSRNYPIKWRMQELEVSREMLAEKLEVTKATIDNWLDSPGLRGKRRQAVEKAIEELGGVR